MNLFVSPEELDITKLGGVNVDELLKKEIDGAVTREAEDRWRCGIKKCTKLFLEEKFVRSHIQKRHKDWLERISLEVSPPHHPPPQERRVRLMIGPISEQLRP